MNLLVNAGQTYVPVNTAISPSSTIKCNPNVTSPGYERPSVDQIISNITSSIWYKDQIVYQLSVEPRIAQTCSSEWLHWNFPLFSHMNHHIAYLDPPISEDISNAVFKSRSIQALYSHQVAAITSVRKGRHVVVSTSTASGKSIIYQVSALAQTCARESHFHQVPVLSCLEERLDATAILIFPTKVFLLPLRAFSS